MNADFVRAPVTPDYVLSVLQDDHRQQCAFDPEADPYAQLSFASSIAEWRHACDLVSTDELGIALNEIWGIDVPADVWRVTLAPAGSRTLRDVCVLIASRAERTLLSPAGYLGGSCSAAGAFLAIRALLLRAGAPPSSIRPSAPIADAARTYPGLFLGRISRLSPGRLPTVAMRHPLYWAALVAFIVGLVGAAALSGSYPTLSVAAALVAGIGWAGSWFAARVLRPADVRFGGIVTFRDLAETIAVEPASVVADRPGGRLA